MTTAFTPPGDPKTDYRVSSIPASQKFAAADYERFRLCITEIQGYLSAGILDASSTIQVEDLDLINDTSPSVGPELDWKGNRGRWFVGVDVANSPTSRDFVITGQRGTYTFADGATTSGSPTLTSASGGGFTTALIGAAISGAGIPSGTTVSAVGGTTSLTLSANATATASGVAVTITRSTSQDLAYWKHRGALSATLGIGVTPPDGTARLQVSPQDDEPAMGTARFRVGPSQTGKGVVVHDSTPIDRWWIDKDFYMSGLNPGQTAAVAIQAHSDANGRALCLASNDKVNVYGLSLPTGSGGVLRLACQSGGNTVADFGTDGSARFLQAVRTSASLRFDSEVAPASIGADQNDYNPGSLANAAVLMLTSSLAVNLTGLTSGSVSGRTLWVYNVGASNITLKHQNASSTAANRFIGRGGADTVLTPNTGVQLFWSASQTRWIILGDTL